MGIYFENNASLNRIIRNKAGARWSGKGKCWYLPLSKENHNRLFLALEGRAKIEQSALYQYLVERKSPIAGKASSRSLQSAIPPLNQGNPPREIHAKAQWPAKQSAGFYESGRIYEVNAHILPAMEQQLKLKAYSPSTIRTYINEMMQLLKKLKNIPADSLLPEHLKRYFVYCYEELRLTENTLHSRINALKFYYEQVLFREKFFWEIPRPKKPLLLPRFFNQAEVASIIKAVGNLKHKVMLMLAYASGLRVSEVVSLKTRNIDSKRMCILIEQAKGKKDRMVALSPALLVMLREYWKKYKPSREGFLFSGQVKGQPYSTRSLQSVLQAAKQKAEVLKPGSIHALRHSFATHLLDKGTDVAMIMKLLGHNDIKTTLRYLHVTNRDLLQIISPLDSLDLD